VNKRLRIPSSLIAIALPMACLGGCSSNTPRDGSSLPAVCSSLEHSTALHELEGALIDLASPASQGKGRSIVREAASSLRNISGDAPSPARPAFTNTASALDSLAVSGIANAAAVNAVNDALASLGSEVESQCHFSLG
jgi:hypothetical protein